MSASEILGVVWLAMVVAYLLTMRWVWSEP